VTRSAHLYLTDAADCYRRSSVVSLSVCLSIGLSVCNNCEPCKIGQTDRDAICDVTLVGTRNHVLGGGVA